MTCPHVTAYPFCAYNKPMNIKTTHANLKLAMNPMKIELMLKFVILELVNSDI
jgi:hypothetical protein